MDAGLPEFGKIGLEKKRQQALAMAGPGQESVLLPWRRCWRNRLDKLQRFAANLQL